jgi:hypothetical protein
MKNIIFKKLSRMPQLYPYWRIGLLVVIDGMILVGKQNNLKRNLGIEINFKNASNFQIGTQKAGGPKLIFIEMIQNKNTNPQKKTPENWGLRL